MSFTAVQRLHRVIRTLDTEAVLNSFELCSFVVPHLIRLVLGTNRLVLPVSAVAGASVLLWSDLIARTVFAPSELPVGVVTGLIGGPYFIYLLSRSGWLR